MEKNKFKFCPQCASDKIQTLNNGQKWFCPECSFELYNNVAAAVGLILTDADGRILFEKRAKEPRKNFLALPGGFSDPDESAGDAARRECKEELGFFPENIKYLCSFPNTYEYGKIQYKTCDLFFTADLPKDFSIKTQENEVSELAWIKIETDDDIENCPLAFDSAKKTLKIWLGEKNKNGSD